LLTPQGKITTDFLITEAPSGHGGGFLIDCPRALAQGLADKLGFYKLRAKVTSKICRIVSACWRRGTAIPR
jgi:folate-binding Fe-S cluster repair protein YgfZ